MKAAPEAPRNNAQPPSRRIPRKVQKPAPSRRSAADKALPVPNTFDREPSLESLTDEELRIRYNAVVRENMRRWRAKLKKQKEQQGV